MTFSLTSKMEVINEVEITKLSDAKELCFPNQTYVNILDINRPGKRTCNKVNTSQVYLIGLRGWCLFNSVWKSLGNLVALYRYCHPHYGAFHCPNCWNTKMASSWKKSRPVIHELMTLLTLNECESPTRGLVAHFPAQYLWEPVSGQAAAVKLWLYQMVSTGLIAL